MRVSLIVMLIAYVQYEAQRLLLGLLWGYLYRLQSPFVHFYMIVAGTAGFFCVHVLVSNIVYLYMIVAGTLVHFL